MRYFFLLLLLGASVGAFVVFIIPRYNNLKTLRETVLSFDGRLETADKLKVSREELIARYNSISKVDLDNIKILLPDSVDNIRLIIQLDSLATKNGLSSVRNVQYDEIKNTTDPAKVEGNLSAQKPYGEFSISFETTGQYKNFLSFISDLEQNLRLVDVVSVKFAAADGNGNSPADNLKYTVKLKTYWLKK